MTTKTKAELEADVRRLTKAVTAAEVQAKEAADKIPSPPRRVPEADALAGCIRAIDALERDDVKPASNYGYSSQGHAESIRHRVIRSLIERYGYRIPEPVTINAAECARMHVEGAPEPVLVAALRGQFYEAQTPDGANW